MGTFIKFEQSTLTRFEENYRKTHNVIQTKRYLQVLASALATYGKVGCFHTVLRIPHLGCKPDFTHLHKWLERSINKYLMDKYRLNTKKYHTECKAYAQTKGKSCKPIKPSKSKYTTKVFYSITKEYVKDKESKEFLEHYHAVFYFNGLCFNKQSDSKCAQLVGAQLREVILKAWMKCLKVKGELYTYSDLIDNATKRSYQLLDQYSPFFWNYFKQEIIRASYNFKHKGKMDRKSPGEKFYYASKATHAFPNNLMKLMMTTVEIYQYAEFSRYKELRGNFRLGGIRFRSLANIKLTKKAAAYIESDWTEHKPRPLDMVFIYDPHYRQNPKTKLYVFGVFDPYCWIDNTDKRNGIREGLLRDDNFDMILILEGCRMIAKPRKYYQDRKRIVDEEGHDLEVFMVTTYFNVLTWPTDKEEIRLNREEYERMKNEEKEWAEKMDFDF